MPLDSLSRSAPVVFKPCVTSTNTLLKGLASCGVPDGFVLAAAKQTSGRGRLGRGFESPEGGLYLSMLLYPRCPLERVQTLTPCVAVALCRALERACGVTPEIKWPNDLLINGKKLCGILVEASTVRGRLYVVIGMGLNINTAPADFPEELRDTAGSLFGELDRRFELEDVAASIIEELDAMYSAWQTDPVCCLADYRRLCVSINRPVTLIQNGVSRAAFARDIDESYALVADVDGAEEHISMGEISLRNA